MKISDLVRIDYEGWAIAEEAEYLKDIIMCGIIIDKYVGGHYNREYIIVYTTDGEYKTYTTDTNLPPTITVISVEEH